MATGGGERRAREVMVGLRGCGGYIGGRGSDSRQLMPKLNHLSIEVHADARATWHSFNCYASGRVALLPSSPRLPLYYPLYSTLYTYKDVSELRCSNEPGITHEI